MRIFRLLLVLVLALPVGAFAQGKLNVVTTTEDLGSLAREVGGDKVSVTALAKGYQDPHFVDPKPSFILAVSRADVLIVVGRELEIGWLPPLLTSSRNGKIQLGGKGYLDASTNVRILEIPTGQITRAMGDVHPLGNRTTGSSRATAAALRRRSATSSPRCLRPTPPISPSGTAISTCGSAPPRSAGTRPWRRTKERSW